MNAPGMPQLHDVADSFDEAFEGVRESLADARRQLAAWSLANYPSRETLEEQARELRKTLGADAVEVNAIFRDSQVTVASAPKHDEHTVPIRQSLCVITASTASPLAVDDILHDPVVAGHPVVGQWGAWASAPITIGGCAAGTVCGLVRKDPREWNTTDQEALEDMAARIGRMIDIWAGS